MKTRIIAHPNDRLLALTNRMSEAARDREIAGYDYDAKMIRGWVRSIKNAIRDIDVLRGKK